MFVILRICCFIQRTSSSFCCVNRVPGKIQYIHHEFFNFRGQKSNRTYLHCYSGYVDYSMFVILRVCCFIQRTSSGLRYVNRVPCQIQCIHHELINFRGQKSNRFVSPLLLVLCRLFDVRYTPHLLLYTAHIIQFLLC
jgi:hypothetical protein